MISQSHITTDTPMGANLVDGGATFRVWAPRALAVYLNGSFGGISQLEQTPDQLMVKDANGYWTGFIDGAREGDPYQFYVVGTGSRGLKRDPYARELAKDSPFPTCSCLIRNARAYPWHDQGFVAPDFSNMVVYQLHIGTYAPRTLGAGSTLSSSRAVVVMICDPRPLNLLPRCYQDRTT